MTLNILFIFEPCDYITYCDKAKGLIFSHQLDRRRGLTSKLSWFIGNKQLYNLLWGKQICFRLFRIYLWSRKPTTCSNSNSGDAWEERGGDGAQSLPLQLVLNSVERRALGPRSGDCSWAGQETKARMDQDWVFLGAFLSLTLPWVTQGGCWHSPANG